MTFVFSQLTRKTTRGRKKKFFLLTSKASITLLFEYNRRLDYHKKIIITNINIITFIILDF